MSWNCFEMFFVGLDYVTFVDFMHTNNMMKLMQDHMKEIQDLMPK